MKIKLLTLSILVILSTNILNAQTTTEEITDEFFKRYEKSPTKAIDYVFGTNKWMAESKDAAESVTSQLTGFIKLVGDYMGYEKITEKSIGESYKLVSYLIKYDRQPILFTFIFYKPKDKLQIQNFRFDDTDIELEESAKLFRM